jgi:hypothetical protein
MQKQQYSIHRHIDWQTAFHRGLITTRIQYIHAGLYTYMKSKSVLMNQHGALNTSNNCS